MCVCSYGSCWASHPWPAILRKGPAAILRLHCVGGGGRVVAWCRRRAQESATFSTGVAQLRRASSRMFIGTQVQTSALFARTILTGGHQSGFGGQHGYGELESSQSSGPPSRTGAVLGGSICGWGRIAPRRPETGHRCLPPQRAVLALFGCRASDDRQKVSHKFHSRRRNWKTVMRGDEGEDEG